MSEPLLSSNSINIAGHKVPIALLGVLAAAAGVLVVMRSRSSGSNVASAGTPSLADQQSVGVLGQGQEAQLANLAQGLATLSQQLNPPATTVTAAPTGFAEPPLSPDPGYSFGPVPDVSGGGDASYTWAWSFSPQYRAAHPEVAGDRSAHFGTPPNAAYGWEWSILPQRGQLSSAPPISAKPNPTVTVS